MQVPVKRDDLLPTIGSLPVGFSFTAGSPMKEDGMLLRWGIECVNDGDEETEDGPYSGLTLPFGGDEDEGLAFSVSDRGNHHDKIWSDTTAYSVNKVRRYYFHIYKNIMVMP